MCIFTDPEVRHTFLQCDLNVLRAAEQSVHAKRPTVDCLASEHDPSDGAELINNDDVDEQSPLPYVCGIFDDHCRRCNHAFSVKHCLNFRWLASKMPNHHLCLEQIALAPTNQLHWPLQTCAHSALLHSVTQVVPDDMRKIALPTTDAKLANKLASHLLLSLSLPMCAMSCH